MICRPRAARAFPTMNPTSTGSTVPGIPPIPIPKDSTSARHGRHPKSSWTTSESWFSNPPDPARQQKKMLPLPKKSLARRSGKLRSSKMNFDPKFPNIARSRRKSTIFRAETPPTAAPEHLSRPLFPRNPHFPALRSRPPALSTAFIPKQIPSSRRMPAHNDTILIGGERHKIEETVCFTCRRHRLTSSSSPRGLP